MLGWCNAISRHQDYGEVGISLILNGVWRDLADSRPRTFALFKHLGEKDVPLIPYVMSSPSQPSRYNDETIIGEGDKENKDQYKVSETHGGKIQPE